MAYSNGTLIPGPLPALRPTDPALPAGRPAASTSETAKTASASAAEKAVLSPEQTKLKKATQEFESIFIGMMLKQMRKSMTGGNALFGSSSESKMYQDMSDDATAEQMSKIGSFGLAHTLFDSLQHLVPSETKAQK